VAFESKEGRRAVLANVIVDASGDLDLIAKAGGGGIAHCLNTGWLWPGVDFARWLEFKRDHPAAHRQLMADAVALFLGRRLSGYSGVSVSDLTRVEVESRMVAHLEYFRRHAPGFEHAWLMLSAPQIGVRHTRRLVGRHKLTIEDWRSGIRFDDEIGVSPSPSQKFANVSVPYRALVARDLDNLLAPGRHMACDPQTQAFMREIPQCWLTGALQAELSRQGVYLQSGLGARDSIGAIAGGPPRGPKVSITADTPAL
jgi:hypothetical protein